MDLPRASRPLATLAVGCLLLTGCGGAAQPEAPPSTSTPSSTTTTSGAASTSPAAPSPSSSSSGTSGAGCAPTGQEVPAGAAVKQTADLDHDGRPDELWLADSTPSSSGGALERRLGVRTASGGVFSVTYTTGSPIPTTAIGQSLDPSTSIVLLSDGRQVPLYAVLTGSGVGACRLVPSLNAQGQQYTFDLGFTGYGSGVACVPVSQGSSDPDAELALYGLLVTGGQAEGDLPGITRTRIELTDGGRQARNGPTDAPAELQGINPEGAQVAAARQVRCGDQGPDTAVTEPTP
ncbi:hypothetical protein [Quadrisphaera granulorum]|uniref:hypothetical protein n=1 Tax=Quadrisphaera granulorum TaxID=317664 RepID=UPI0011B38ED1|nr:hypothetical protein [Quadrisphaera granulorum]